jgi:preprotein translocase subunit SecE
MGERTLRRSGVGSPGRKYPAQAGRQGAASVGRFRETERQMASKTINPFTFLQQVRAETAKVTWPSRRETTISTVMVVIFAFIAAIFFFAADLLMGYGVEFILGIGR